MSKSEILQQAEEIGRNGSKFGRLIENLSPQDSTHRFSIEGCVSMSTILYTLSELSIPSDQISDVYKRIKDFHSSGGVLLSGNIIFEGDPFKELGIKRPIGRQQEVPVMSESINRIAAFADYVEDFNPPKNANAYICAPQFPITITPLKPDRIFPYHYQTIIPNVNSLKGNITGNIMNNLAQLSHKMLQHTDTTEYLISDIDMVRATFTQIALENAMKGR